MLIVWLLMLYFQCAEWIFKYSVSKCVIGIGAVFSYTANNDKMVQSMENIKVNYICNADSRHQVW